MTKMLQRRARILAVLAALATSVVACGSQGTSAFPTGTAGPTSISSPIVTPFETATPRGNPCGSCHCRAPIHAAIGVFKLTGNMITARFNHSATLLQDGRVLVAGGEEERGAIRQISTAELYDPATGRFSATGSMHSPRMGQTATLLPNGQVLIAGGQNDNGLGAQDWPNALASAEVYDPASGTFKPTGSMHTARTGHTATLLGNGRVLIAGGLRSMGDALVGSVELYDPATGKFSPTSSLQTPRYGHTATLLSDGRVLIAGGWSMNGNDMAANAELYDPATGKFSATGALRTARSGQTATLLGDGRVLIAGGSAIFHPDENSSVVLPINSAELYDPATGIFAVTGSMFRERDGHTATLLPDGRVLVGGGEWMDTSLSPNSIEPTDQAEVYDPASGAFEETSSMTVPRRFHTATLLPDGQVLATGGQDADEYAIVSAELYVPAPAP